MANTLLTPSIIAREALAVLENNLVMGGLVYRGYDSEFRSVGESISVRVPATFTERDVASDKAGAGLQTQDATELSTTITLNQHKYVRFSLSEKDAALNIRDFSAQFIVPSMIPLVQGIDQRLARLARQIPYVSGTAGTTPSALSDIAACRKALNDNKAPMDRQRYLVMDTTAAAELLPVMAEINAPKGTQTNQALEDATLGRIFGFDTYESQNIEAHTNGVPGGAPTATGTAGEKTITVAAGGAGGTYLEGDLFTVAGDATIYTATAALTLSGAGAGTLNCYPALATSPAGAAITLVAAHTKNVAFHRNAFALVTAPLAMPRGGATGEVVTYKNISMRAVYSWDNSAMADVITIDILYGVKAIHPELAAVMYG